MSAVSTLAGGAHRGVDGAVAGARDSQRGEGSHDELDGSPAAALAPGATGRPVEPVELGARERHGAAASPTEQALDREHRRLKVRRYRSLMLHWMARWLRAPAPVVPDPLVPVRADEVAVTFVGHASALLRYPQVTVAFDPMLGNWVGAARRAVRPGLTAADFREVGLILISHRHLDHLHPQTMAQMPRQATVVVPPGGAAILSPLGFERVIELRPGARLECAGLKISTFALAHGGQELATGLNYLLRGAGPSVFLFGDSAYDPGFAAIGARYAPDIALLPIGGFWPRGFRRRHMSPLDALAAFKDLASRALVPIHHGAFALSYERLDEPLRLLLTAAEERRLREYVVAMAPGQTDIFAADAVARRDAARLDSLEEMAKVDSAAIGLAVRARRVDDGGDPDDPDDDDRGGAGGRVTGPLPARGR
jgi:L-ascorbate metabolism protein UlaG (beta-lactamase superfamily)